MLSLTLGRSMADCHQAAIRASVQRWDRRVVAWRWRHERTGAMRTTARVVVIGGGVVGVSTLYHLAKKGWSDCVLLERTELTAGSTWHAAGLLPLFNMSYSVGQLHQYSVELYKRLEAETGQDVSFHVCGNLRLATNRDRMDEYRNYQCTAETTCSQRMSPAVVLTSHSLLSRSMPVTATRWTISAPASRAPLASAMVTSTGAI
jgi:glycine/D-amino acid oxidase-like deaminating enzyme